MVRYSGGKWNALLPSPAPGQLLYDVSALWDASGEAWAVCMSGKIYHYSYDLSGWFEVLPQPTTRQLRRVEAISRDDVWAVGEGYWGEGGSATVLHFDGTSWSQFPSTAYGWMEDVSAVASDDIWGCGNDQANSAVLYHYDGSSWSAQRLEGVQDLWGIHARASDDVWAVGKGGTVLHYNGNNWANLSGATSEDLIGVVAPHPGMVWLVGANGLIIRGDAAAPVVTSVFPSSGVNNESSCEVAITGDDFQDKPTSVKLIGPAVADVYPLSLTP